MRKAMLCSLGVGLSCLSCAGADHLDRSTATNDNSVRDLSMDGGGSSDDAADGGWGEPIGVCGNGQVEGSEVCDEGPDNGLRPHCAVDCSRVCTEDGPTCFTPIASALVCGGDKRLTWGAPTRHYAIIANAELPAGCTLTIAAGVRIRFRYAPLFAIKGTLEIAGTASAPVILERATGDAPNSMLSLSSESSVTIRHARFESNTPCIWGVGGGLSVENSEFVGCSSGIIWASEGTGGLTSTGGLTIANNRFVDFREGVRTGSDRGPSQKAIEGNSFSDGLVALTIEGTAEVLLRNNLIENNSGGIVCSECERTTITHNAIRNNGGAPAYSKDAGHPVYYGAIHLLAGEDVVVTHNDIRDNFAPPDTGEDELGAAGVVIEGFSDGLLIQHNTLSSSAGDLPVLVVGPLAQAPAVIDASSNFWGAATTAEMDSMGASANIPAIFDNRDDLNRAAVIYDPWLSAPAVDVGPESP